MAWNGTELWQFSSRQKQPRKVFRLMPPGFQSQILSLAFKDMPSRDLMSLALKIGVPNV
jgi:hypothetical protein